MSARAHPHPADGEVLRVQGLAKSFGGLTILQDVSFSVRKGERRAFIGPNGAGKSTLFNMLAGDLPASDGHIHYFEENITRLPNYQRVDRGIVRSFQKNNLFLQLSVLENLLLVLQRQTGLERVWYRSRVKKNFPGLYDQAEQLLVSWGLADRKEQNVGELSYGEQRQVEILLAVATRPQLLLLDEPTAGMSNLETQHIVNLLRRMPEDLTILIIEHDMDVVFGLADTVTLLHNGGVYLEGEPQAIRNDPRVYEVYFGGERD